ncbi:putative protein without homology [Propionibacterium freudenreichii subsp. shermanii]|nr:putative protein without homology [Propionibacterium freudenreichii subsp. shermanii]
MRRRTSARCSHAGSLSGHHRRGRQCLRCVRAVPGAVPCTAPGTR